MAIFAYQVIDTNRRLLNGTLVADTPRQARDHLRARGWVVQQVQEHRDSSVWAWGRFRSRRQTVKVVSFIRELSTLLGVGIPLLEAIDTILKQHKGGLRTSLLHLREGVAAGTSLAEAMAEQPLLFDSLCVSIAEVGENAGTLDSALERLAEFKERSSTFKSRVGTALIYPAIVLAMAAGVSVFLMSFVVPGLLGALIETGRPIPLATRIVKGASDLLVQHWWLLLVLLALGAVGIHAGLRTRWGRLNWHRLQLRIPVLGPMLRKQAVVRLCVVLSTLLKSGMMFVRALEIARQSTTNLILRQALEECEDAVTGGRDIAQALERSGAFSPVVVQVFAVGQHSGRLEEMLDRLAGDYDQQLHVATQRLTALLEPILILLLVFVVGFIMFATVLPMLEAADVL